MKTAAPFVDDLNTLNACEDAVEWAGEYKSLGAAWDVCQRGDWMLWLVGRMAGPSESDSRKAIVLCCCECARLALKHVPNGEDRPRLAIEAAERWAKDEGGTLIDVRAAADAAYDYVDAADATAYAAAYAAAARAATAAARNHTLSECADIVRKHYPNPPVITAEDE